MPSIAKRRCHRHYLQKGDGKKRISALQLLTTNRNGIITVPARWFFFVVSVDCRPAFAAISRAANVSRSRRMHSVVPAYSSAFPLPLCQSRFRQSPCRTELSIDRISEGRPPTESPAAIANSSLMGRFSSQRSETIPLLSSTWAAVPSWAVGAGRSADRKCYDGRAALLLRLLQIPID